MDHEVSFLIDRHQYSEATRLLQANLPGVRASGDSDHLIDTLCKLADSTGLQVWGF
jgi:hypothetical protein